MLKVDREEKGEDLLVVHLSGAIDEKTDFDRLIGKTPSELHVYTKNVTRINSDGVRYWIRYFQLLNQKDVKVKYFDCSTAIVEQMNMISNFICGGEVVSIYVPFVCRKCGKELLGVLEVKTIQSLKENNQKIPDQTCTHCGGEAQFDDIWDEYFRVWTT